MVGQASQLPCSVHYSLIGARASCRAEVEARNVEALVSAGRLEDAHAAASALFTLCVDAGLQARVSSFAHARDVMRVVVLHVRIDEASMRPMDAYEAHRGSFMLCHCAYAKCGPLMKREIKHILPQGTT